MKFKRFYLRYRLLVMGMIFGFLAGAFFILFELAFSSKNNITQTLFKEMLYKLSSEKADVSLINVPIKEENLRKQSHIIEKKSEVKDLKKMVRVLLDNQDIMEFEESNSEKIVINKEKLLISYVVLTEDSSLKVQDNLDSLLIDDNNTYENEVFYVEFWETPLKYTGYKMARNKIRLYGINPTDSIRLILGENNSFIYLNQNIYVINYSDFIVPFTLYNDSITD